MAWPMIYRVRTPGGDQDSPVLAEYLWDDLPTAIRDGRKRVLSSMHKNSADDDMICFYSGVKTYLSTHQFRYAPWEVTREHLVAVSHDGAGNGGSNIVFVGALLNSKLGHSPLPIKLQVKSYLATAAYDRSQSTYETFRKVIGHVIDLENSLKIEGRYPWQPNTYALTDPCYSKVQAFCDEMRKAEEEFLALTPDLRREWVRDFQWRW